MSTIDVVVPCYNYARFLDRCVDSILGQEGVQTRVLVIDDTSSDDTPEVGRRLSARDPRVTFRRHEKNLGHIRTYNEGLLDWATSEYSLLISADDVLAPGALKRATDLLDAHPDAGMTYGMAVVFQDDVPSAASESGSEDHRVLSGEQFLAHCFHRAYCPVSTPTAVVRTAAQKEVGGYSTDLPHSADLEMWMRFAARGSIGVLRSRQAYYRWHAGNMGSQYYNQALGDRREFMLTCNRVLERWGSRYPQSAAWREALHRQVGRDALRSAEKCFELGDVEGSRAWRQLAYEVRPQVRGSGLWWRFQAKQWVGMPAWNRARAVVHRLRGVSADAAQSSHFRGFRAGQQVGWWPG